MTMTKELSFYRIRDTHVTNDVIMKYFDVTDVKYKRPEQYHLYFMTTDSDHHDIMGDTGTIVGVSLAVGNTARFTKWLKKKTYTNTEICEEVQANFPYEQ